ncbi:MAG: ankyrin repeat domain-containing protein, partial [Betaproteobacteria bacterium]|nr:ankyrin repeat domain-containing protein [Betaproteobacteria bacterium]
MGKNSTGLFHSVQFFKKANLAQVKVCLEAGGKIDGHDEHGNSPLHWAAALSPHPEVIDALVNAGADPDCPNERGETPLHTAAAFNPNDRIIDALCTAGGDPHRRNEEKWTPLHAAAANSNKPAVIRTLLAVDADPNSVNNNFWTPLMIAVVYNRIEISASSKHIKEGINPQHHDGGSLYSTDDFTFLPGGLASPHPQIIADLIESGADVNHANLNKQTPLHAAAACNSSPDTIAALI